MKPIFIHSRVAVLMSIIFSVSLVSRTTAQQASAARQLEQPATSQANQRRTALVIGNADYKNTSTLLNPAHDAEDIAATLKELGFDLIGQGAQLNQTADQMKRLILEFGDRLSNGGGVGLFYYAGHGVQSQNHNYLIPVEASILREKTLEFEGVDVNRVLAEMDAAGNGFNVVILDACRNNPFTRGWRDAAQGLAQVNAPEGTLLAYATSPGRVSEDGNGRNGTYTAELLLKMRLPGLTIEEMFKAVRASVKAATRNQQTPWESSSLVGQFCFAGKCPVTASTLPVTQAPLREKKNPGNESTLTTSVTRDAIEAHLRVGRTYFAEGSYDKAIAQYEEALHLRPNNPDVYYEMARCYMAKRRYITAINTYNKVITLDNRNAKAYYSLGQVFRFQQQYGRAIQAFQRAINLDERYFDAHLALGATYLAQDQNDLAAEMFKRAIAIRSDDDTAHFYLARAYHNQNMLSAAAEEYSRTIAINPESADAVYDLGQVYSAQERYEDARIWYRRAIELTPNAPNAYYALGVAYAKSGNKTAAMDQYKILREISVKMAETLLSEINK